MRQFLVMLALIVVVPLVVAEERPRDEQCKDISGVCKGMVVRVEGQSFTLRSAERGELTFLPRWIGGQIRAGGHVDQQSLDQITALQPGEYIEVAWEKGERLRAVRITALGQQRSGQRPVEPAGAETGSCLDGPGPAERCGTVRGTVATVDPKGRFTVETENGQEVFMPMWKGGMPAEGGGFDPAMVSTIAGLAVGQRVVVSWTWDERKRCIGVK